MKQGGSGQHTLARYEEDCLVNAPTTFTCESPVLGCAIIRALLNQLKVGFPKNAFWTMKLDLSMTLALPHQPLTLAPGMHHSFWHG
jgi:hypothetical protein